MTREEAISLLRRYRRAVYRYNPKFILFAKRDALFHQCVYGKFLIEEMIREIRYSDEDPIEVVCGIYSYLDWILGESDDDHFETHRFAALMEHEAGNILRYLKTIEKEQNEDAKNELERGRQFHSASPEAEIS